MKNLGKCIIKFLNKIFEHKAKVTTVPEKELRIKYFFFSIQSIYSILVQKVY